MADLTLAPPTEQDVAELLANIRPIDLFEMRAVIGNADPETTIWSALQGCDWPTTVRAPDGALMLLGGLRPISLLNGIGCPWLLGTPAVERHPGALMRLARRYLPVIRARYPTLVNYVSADNKTTIRWLTRLGFDIRPERPYGPTGAPFHPFVMEV